MLDQVFEYIIIVIIAVAVFIIAIFSDVKNFFESFEEISERICDVEGNSIVTLGEHKFKIPSTLLGAYIAGNGSSPANKTHRHEPYTKICPTGPNSRFERKQFLIRTPPRSELTWAHLPFAANINVTLNKRNAPRPDLFEGRRVGANVDWESSGEYRTTVHTFTGIGGGGPWRVRLFVSKDEGFVTPSGNLVAFQCSMGGKKTHRIKRCSTWFAWSDDIQVLYSFSDQDYPTAEWRTLHDQVVEYINSIELSVDPERRTGATAE